MGLTVHYQLSALKLDTAAARRVVKQGHALALRRQQAGEVHRVNAVREDVTAHPLARQWVMYSIPGSENTFSGIEVKPVEGFLFAVNVGEDCEPLTLGLCRFPETVLHNGASVPTKLGGGWRFAGFSKTQYASLHGWEHFLRCHRAVVESLAEWRALGVRVKISDEGEYWPRRSTATLRRNVEQMNGLVAAVAGTLKDADDGAGAGVQSPIFAHKDFERLEAEGEARAGAVVREARGEISRQLQKSGH